MHHLRDDKGQPFFPPSRIIAAATCEGVDAATARRIALRLLAEAYAVEDADARARMPDDAVETRLAAIEAADAYLSRGES